MGPKTSAGRVAKFREKTKTENPEKWTELLRKDRERNHIKRQKEKVKCSENEELLQKKREMTRKRVQNWRKKKALEKKNLGSKNKSPEKIIGSYASTSTLRKAVIKAKRNLPFSPKKKRAVVRQLVKETFNSPSELYNVTKFSKSRLLPKDVGEKVQQFFETDEISWQAPAKRDYISVRDENTGQKIQKQKRFLVMTISEAHKIFMDKHKIKISLSKFHELRPKYVMPVSNTPHNVCVCIQHANFKFLSEAISPQCDIPESSLTHKTLIGKMCCNTENEDCMSNNCETCYYDIKFLLKTDCDLSQQVKWKEWKKCEGWLQVTENTASLEDLVMKINTVLPSFKSHTFVKNEQAQFFEEKKSNLTKAEAVIQVDYAENYSLISQDEVQSAHWQHSQVTIFTCCLWLQNMTESYVVVSDDLSHSKQSAWTFLKTIVSDFKQNHPELKIQRLYVFSDNCASQFKSKYTVFNMCFLADDLDVQTVQWNTFAAGHGKGAVDAIGGQIKRTVWTAIKARTTQVGSPKDFYLCAKSLEKKTRILYVPERDVQETSLFLNKRWESVQEIPGIRNYHHFERYDDKYVLASFTHNSEKKKVPVVFPLTSSRQNPPQGTRWRFKDVYSSDSESGTEESAISQDQEVKRPVDPKCIIPGTYIIVTIQGEGPKHSLTHNYVAVCQTGLCNELSAVRNIGEVGVMFLKSYGTTGKMFVTDENDQTDINFSQISSVLPTPNVKKNGTRLVYEFQNKIKL